MKKLIYCAAALAAMIFAGSCQRENLEPVAQEATVTLSVELPGVQTKTIGDGFNVDQLVYEVWKTEKAEETDLNGQGKATRLYQETATMAKLNGEQKTVISLNLVHDQNYTILFWAQNSKAINDAPAYDTDDLTAVTYANSVTDGSYFSNNENMAAFYNIAFLTAKEIEKPTTKRVELKRPFAQLNIGTMNTAEEYTVTMNKSKVTISNVPTVFNVAQNTPQTPAVSDLKSFVFNYGNVPSDPATLTVNTTPYQYVAMNYIFAGNENVKVYYKIDATLTAKDTKAETTAYVENKVIEVPLKENYRTNIVGNLLTSTTKYEVVIDADWAWNEGDTPEWEGNHIEVWNGTEVTAPTKNDANQYVIEYPSELAWLAAAVNGTLPETKATVDPQTFAGETFVLAADVDLNNFEWTPIGNSANPFKGTFDGNGKTVKNLLITGNNANVGLFGMTTDGEIKNLVVENAKVSGRLNVGVVAGTPYTSKYTDITVQGHVEVNGMAYVGGVGGKNAYADWTDITVNVDETSYVKANSVENGTAYRTYVGGVVGFNGEGGHSFKNITSNINVEGSTCDVGGLFGIAHYGNLFENCVCTGNVEITAAEEAEEAEEVGGIAGVWHNQSGQTVTMTNVAFSGQITTNIQRGTVWYGNLVGKPYGSGEGELVLNGNKFTVAGISLENINETLASGDNFVFPFDLEGAADASNAYGKTGLNQLNGGIIDGNGFTLEVPNAGGTWDSAINTTGGTIRNLTVASGFRGIFVNHNSDYASKVILENVTVDGPVYTISCDQGTNNGLEAVNSTFNGWTSYAATIGNVKFTSCSFGEGSGYAYCRPYAPTEFIGCAFEAGFQIDPRASVTFENCTLDGVALTIENIATLVTSNSKNITSVNGLAAVSEGVWGQNGVYTVTSAAGLTNALAMDDAQTINLTSGSYKGTFAMKSNVTIEGTEGAVVDCINLNGKEKVTLKNITFDAAGAAMSYGGDNKERYYANIFSRDKSNSSTVTGAKDLVIEGCHFIGTFPGNGGCVTSFADQHQTGSHNVTIKNCIFEIENCGYAIYGYYTGNNSGNFVIENNTFKSATYANTIYLGRYKSNMPVVLKNNNFEKVSTLNKAIYVQAHSEEYTVSIEDVDNSFAE